jgi:hypothetical protein
MKIVRGPTRMFAEEIAKIAEIAKIGKARPHGENTDHTDI